MVSFAYPLKRSALGLVYAWAGIVLMWAFWVSFVVFLAEPRQILRWWPLPTINRASDLNDPWIAALIDCSLIALFGLQHSVMARLWFKARAMGQLPDAFQRCTYVHMANISLITLIVCWQPIPLGIWTADGNEARLVLELLFASGWIILFLAAWSFGIGELLGLDQMRAWIDRRPAAEPQLKTGRLYRWLRHPMYVGVLMGVWATPRMTFGHALLALGLTAYVLIGVRYEERDLLTKFGSGNCRWRSSHHDGARGGGA